MIVILFFSLLVLTGCIFEAPCAFCNVEHPVHILMSLALSNGLLMVKPLKKFNYKNEPTEE